MSLNYHHVIDFFLIHSTNSLIHLIFIYFQTVIVDLNCFSMKCNSDFFFKLRTIEAINIYHSFDKQALNEKRLNKWLHLTKQSKYRVLVIIVSYYLNDLFDELTANRVINMDLLNRIIAPRKLSCEICFRWFKQLSLWNIETISIAIHRCIAIDEPRPTPLDISSRAPGK